MKTSCERTRLPGRPVVDEIMEMRRKVDKDLEQDPITAQTIAMPDPHCHICRYPAVMLRLMMADGTPVLVCPNCEASS